MRQVIALFFIALIGASFAVGITETEGIPAMTQTALPREILAEVAARIASNGPLQDIGKLFNTLEGTIRKEQVKHDDLSAKQKTECQSEITFRTKEIADAGAALSRATDEKTACSTSLHQNKIELKTNRKTQSDLTSNVQVLDSTRASERALFQKRAAGFTAALNALAEGYRILQELYSGSATLLDLSKATASMFTNAMAIGVGSDFAPVVGAMAQVAQKSELLVDPNVLARIEDLFGQLRQKLEAGLAADEDAETKATNVYNKIKGRLVKQLKSLKKAETSIVANIGNLEQCISKASNIISLATNKKERNTNLLSGANKMCKNFEEEYTTATNQRKEELQLVNKLRKIVAEKLKMSAQVTDRASEEVSEFKAHENVAEIKGPKEWTKKATTYNEAGAKIAGYSRDKNLEAI